MGDNPSASFGPTLEVEWGLQDRLVVGLDEFERTREAERRRNSEDLRMPMRVREEMLLSNGYTLSEIKRTSKQREEERRKNSKTGIFKKARTLFLPANNRVRHPA